MVSFNIVYPRVPPRPFAIFGRFLVSFRAVLRSEFCTLAEHERAECERGGRVGTVGGRPGPHHIIGEVVNFQMGSPGCFVGDSLGREDYPDFVASVTAKFVCILAFQSKWEQ